MASPDSCTLSSAPHSRCPGCPGPTALAGSCLHLWPPGCTGMPSRLVGLGSCGNPRQLISCALVGQERAALPLQRHVFQPPAPQAGAGQGGQQQARRQQEKERHRALAQAGLSQSSSAPRSPASATPRVPHGDDGAGKEHQQAKQNHGPLRWSGVREEQPQSAAGAKQKSCKHRLYKYI